MIEELLEKVKKQDTKFIFVTGGVCSSLGKGVLISSLGVLLKNSGYSVSVVKWDPYLNVDPGTMSPLEHGEVFVTDDGAETDLDLGHYERVLELNLDKNSSLSSGQIYEEILKGEREGKFLGKCIQLVPHVVNAIKARLYKFALAKKTDFVLVEIGGTIGDMEGVSFLEALRQLRIELEYRKLMHCHLSLVPTLSWTGEIKTKPTQHSVLSLHGSGLSPDSLFLRADRDIPEKAFKKLSVMCEVDKDLIFQALTYKPFYHLFFDLEKQMVNERIQSWFGMKKNRSADLGRWNNLLNLISESEETLKVALIAKYVGNNDPYISVVRAIKNAGYLKKRKIEIVVIEAEELDDGGYNGVNAAWRDLQSVDGIVIPGGFDSRGVDGKIFAAQWARENKIPFLGLCLGLQVMLIEFARSVLNLKDASSREFDKTTKNPVIDLLQEQVGVDKKGGTMRLGAYPCALKSGTLASEAYKKEVISERHRHRYEFNNDYKKQFEENGIVFSGIYKEKDLVEIAEVKDHPFMLGTQFHPEFKSTPLSSHPLFDLFVDFVIKGAVKK